VSPLRRVPYESTYWQVLGEETMAYAIAIRFDYVSPRANTRQSRNHILMDIPDDTPPHAAVEAAQRAYMQQEELDRLPSVTWQCATDAVSAMLCRL
jgi:hypothetical protein